MIRLFVGLGLPPEVAATLASLGGGIPHARWVEARNLHVTLRFIGEVEDGLAREIHDELTGLRCPAFTLEFKEFGTFGRPNPNHLWLGIEKVPPLMQLQAKVDHVMVRLGLPPEGRKYTPHVTLARFRAPPVNRVQDFIARHSPFQSSPLAVDQFVLFRSHLGRTGAEYEPLAEYELGG